MPCAPPSPSVGDCVHPHGHYDRSSPSSANSHRRFAMKDMTAEAERGDIEPTLRDVDDSDAELRAALEKDRQRAQQVRRNARATYRVMEGWQRVGSGEDWPKVCADSQ